MKKVEAYQSSDGKFWATEEEAILQEQKLLVGKMVKEFEETANVQGGYIFNVHELIENIIYTLVNNGISASQLKMREFADVVRELGEDE